MQVVQINKDIKGGTPVIAGTRIPVTSVIYLHRNLKKSAVIIATKYYTQVSVDQIKAVIEWFEKNENNYGRLDI